MSKSTPTKDERTMVANLLDEAAGGNTLITEWEAEEFLPSLQEQTFWSQKQRDILQAIWEKVM